MLKAYSTQKSSKTAVSVWGALGMVGITRVGGGKVRTVAGVGRGILKGKGLGRPWKSHLWVIYY